MGIHLTVGDRHMWLNHRDTWCLIRDWTQEAVRQVVVTGVSSRFEEAGS
jgi:hypothetical protein